MSFFRSKTADFFGVKNFFLGISGVSLGRTLFNVILQLETFKTNSIFRVKTFNLTVREINISRYKHFIFQIDTSSFSVRKCNFPGIIRDKNAIFPKKVYMRQI